MKLMTDNNYFGFLVHAREIDDFYLKYPYLRFVPKRVTETIIKYSPPIVVSKINGVKTTDGQILSGYILGVTLTAKQMVEDRELSLKRIREAVLMAKKMNIKILGLGALTASLSRGGLDVKGLGVGINTGRAFTVRNICAYVDWLEDKLRFDKKVIKIGVVGAAGSIGSSTAEFLKQKGYKNFILVDLESKIDSVISWANDLEDDVEVITSHKLSVILDADIIIAATNAPEVVIHPDDLKQGAIIINDAQPSDISPEVLSERPDVLAIEGGIVRIPGLNSGLDLRLKHPNDTFSCLAETIILAGNNHFSDFGLGRLDINLVQKIEKMSKSIPGMMLSPQNINFEIEDIHLNKELATLKM
jgi:fatty aldehyde-generating acyl-ACP reductase